MINVDQIGKEFIKGFIPALLLLAIFAGIVGGSIAFAIDTPKMRELKRMVKDHELNEKTYQLTKDSLDEVIKEKELIIDQLTDSIIIGYEEEDVKTDSLTSLDYDAKLKYIMESGRFNFND